jgi:hypothetical protein
MENNKEKVEFTGVSVSNEKRNAVALFVVEAIVVLIFIVGVLFVLNYFGIFPLSKASPALFGFLPTKEGSYGKYDIEAVSEIPSYKIKLNNEEKLIKLLTDWNIFGREHRGVYFGEGNTNGVSVEKIIIHLTDKEQKTNKFAGEDGDVYLSSNTVISPGRLDVYAHLGNLYLTDEKIKESGIAVLSISLQALYKLDNHLLEFEQRKIRDQGTIDVVSEIIKQNSNYFEVVKEK